MKQRGKDRRRFPRGLERRKISYRERGASFKSWMGSHDITIWLMVIPTVIMVYLMLSVLSKY